jgi:hypothetical protein
MVFPDVSFKFRLMAVNLELAIQLVLRKTKTSLRSDRCPAWETVHISEGGRHFPAVLTQCSQSSTIFGFVFLLPYGLPVDSQVIDPAPSRRCRTDDNQQ